MNVVWANSVFIAVIGVVLRLRHKAVLRLSSRLNQAGTPSCPAHQRLPSPAVFGVPDPQQPQHKLILQHKHLSFCIPHWQGPQASPPQAPRPSSRRVQTPSVLLNTVLEIP